MKPLQIAFLVGVGALGGAVVMLMTRSSAPAPAPAPVVASAPTQNLADAPPPPPAEPPKPVEALPSPFPEAAKSPRPAAERHRAAKHASSKPAVIAQNTAPAVPAPQAAPQPAPSAESNPAEPAPAPAPVVKSEPEPVVPPPPPPPHVVTIAAGTLLPVRLGEGLSSDRNQAGDGFSATLDAPLIVDGFVIAERGSKLEGKVVESDKGGRVKGVSSISIELTRLRTSDGQNIAIQTESFEKTGPKSMKEDVAKVGAAAGIGAAIGAIAGGGKGAGIGAAIGGAAGTGGVMATRGKPAALATETRINFRLRNAVTITEHR